eukprot:ANDGO_02111.mRNA.1 hypothetical protein
MAPGQVRRISFDTTAEYVGTFAAVPSRAYLYYFKEAQSWQSGLHINVNPKD